MDPLIGRTIDNKYLMERLLGKGGMGSVYMAIHTGTKRSVAVKVIAPQFMRNRELLIRFQREAEASGRLRHPNVVNVTDFGVSVMEGTPVAYLVMEYLDGETLQDFLQKTPQPAPSLALEILEQVALGIEEAHSHGILHRDLKPGNIWLQPDGRGGYIVKVLDFGIAKLADPSALSLDLPDFEAAPNEEAPVAAADENATQAIEPTGSSVTSAFSESSGFTTTVGSTLGTPAFMAPEQCLGKAVSEQSDLYSLAMIAYLMFVGELPFKGNARELIEKQTLERPDPPHKRNPKLGETVSRVILESLEKEPEKRAPKLTAFTARLRGVVEGEVLMLKESRSVGSSNSAIWFLVLIASSLPFLPLLYLGRLGAHWLVVNQGFPSLPAAGLLFLLHLSLGYLVMLLSDIGMTAWIVAIRTEEPSFKLWARLMGRALVSFPQTFAASILTMHPVKTALAHIVVLREGLDAKAAQSRSEQLLAGNEHVAFALVARRVAVAFLVALYQPVAFTIAQVPVDIILREYLGGVASNILGIASFSFMPIYGSFLMVWNFLYERSQRGLGEGEQKAIKRFEKAKGKIGQSVRLGTQVWLGVVVLLLALLFVAPALNWNDKFDESLSACVLEGRYSDVERQLKAGEKADGEGGRGRSPLTLAVQNGDRRMVDLLLRYGAKMENSDSVAGPLHYAVITHRPEMLRLLLERGAKVDVLDNTQDTPLMLAAKSGQLDMARALIERGANPRLKDMKGRTALDHARLQGNADIVNLLEGK